MELLELYLSPLDNPTEFKVIVTHSPAGEGESKSSLPFFDAECDWRTTVIRTLDISSFNPKSFSAEGEQEWMIKAGILGSDRSIFSPNYLVNIGQALYKALFPEGSRVEQLLHQSITLAESKPSKLVVQLKLEADVVQKTRLADYPWELLHNRHFLCHHQVEFSRYIAYQAVPPSLPTAEKLNVLLVSSGASDQELNLGLLSKKEQKAVIKGLKTASERGDISLEQLEEGTFAELRTYLMEHRGDKAPHVLHFDGHGLFGKPCPNPKCGAMNAGTKLQRCRKCKTELPSAQGYLVFEDEDGDADYISARELGTLLQQSGLSDGSSQTQGVVLVVLSACHSGRVIAGESIFNGAAQNLIAHRVPAVVAMQYSVSVDSATQFAEQFYRSLGQKNSLVVAVSQARAAMGVEGNQWYRPVLYLRWQDNEGGQLFANESPPITKFHVPKLSGSSVFVRRDQEMEKIIKALLEPDQSNTIIALWGPCGYGKTTLAKLICGEPSIQQYYSGGIYWIEITNDSDAKKGLKKLYKYLTNIEEDVEPEDLLDKWNQKPNLVILDNIGNEEELGLFLRSVGESSQLLITTERLDTLNQCNNPKLIQINSLNIEELIAVLKYPLKKKENFNDQRIKELASLLYDSPVLLTLALKKIQGYLLPNNCSTPEVIIDSVIEEIKEIDWPDNESQIVQNIKQNIEPSFEYLTEKEKEYFHSLFIFFADLDIPFSVIAIIWDLPSLKVQLLCRKLYELSLLRKFKITQKNQGIIQLSSLLRKYFDSRRTSDNEFKQFLVDVNKKLVEYYEKKYELNSPDYLPDNLPLEEKKFFRQVYKYHWRQAKKV
ncbi:MAG: CHAT domain-containing protein [Okeania sp. SIO2C2]|uniref:CHAT domain-containing protein n=1 Tax=Okeania sp. SIO2C2 TaxID=2607787 RepID=UPI0013BCD6EE|nr:CHAT domain-containing protein [Okeania sp. SIO2C2]NEP90958.1 CHAT domain-containing protein [Okeania sp. SIO2C2]